MKIVILFVCLFTSLCGFSQQVDSVKCSEIALDSLLLNISHNTDNIYLQTQSRFKMYNTKNIYNLLLLDTQTGRIWKVQWNLDIDKEFSVSINTDDLSLDGSCFELIPTQNMYQFILLDKTYGRTWHVQWGFEYNERWIRRIY